MTTSLQQHEATLSKRIASLIEALCGSFAKQYGGTPYYTSDSVKYEVVAGTKYYKLVMHQSNSRSVHAFIHKQSGAVFKPANFRAPAKHVRYKLLDDVSYEECLKRADWAGSYLYL